MQPWEKYLAPWDKWVIFGNHVAIQECFFFRWLITCRMWAPRIWLRPRVYWHTLRSQPGIRCRRRMLAIADLRRWEKFFFLHLAEPSPAWRQGLKPFQCWDYFNLKYKNSKDFENHLNPCMLVFIGKLALASNIWVPICQGFSHFQAFFTLFCIEQISHHQLKG